VSVVFEDSAVARLGVVVAARPACDLGLGGQSLALPEIDLALELLAEPYDVLGAHERGIADMTRNVVAKARGVAGLAVDFSGTHSQPDDPGTDVSPALIFGTEAMAELVRAQKRRVDPGIRFRYHPFAKFL
jgi:hypothetical protein